MSYSSSNHLPPRTKLRHVEEFVRALGYEFQSSFKGDLEGGIQHFRSFFWFDDADYRSWTGVELTLYGDEAGVYVETRSVVSRSYYDLQHQNRTIKLLHRHFGGTFETDEGVGRYLRVDAGPPSPAASGCHQAFQRFGANLINCGVYFEGRAFTAQKPIGDHSIWFHIPNPWVLSNTLLLPFLVSVFEDYWKSTYIALLKYSPKKESIFRAGRLTPEQLTAIANGELSVEEAYAETMSFQNIGAICRNFSNLDAKLDFAGVLRRPYRGRKMSLYDSFEQMTEIRHTIIHRAQMDRRVTDDFMQGTLHNVKVGIDRCYKHLTKTRNWAYDRYWSA